MKRYLIPAALLAAAFLAGCGGPANQKAVSIQSVPAASASVPAEQEALLTVYLPNEKGLRVVPHVLQVKAKEKTLKNALFQMIQMDRKAQYPILPTGLTVKNVTVKDGTAVINFSKELKNLSGGTTTETLFAAMIVNTATEFPNVRQVSFEMEGKPLRTLTGHMDFSKPLKRDESMISAKKK